jgi:hypothetical protein
MAKLSQSLISLSSLCNSIILSTTFLASSLSSPEAIIFILLSFKILLFSEFVYNILDDCPSLFYINLLAASTIVLVER